MSGPESAFRRAAETYLSYSRLIRELKTYTSANRMILTGTPLHVSLFCPAVCGF